MALLEPHAGETATEGARFEILRAAASCFMERGYAATSIDDVARRLGATKGMIYHHYPSKADLFAGVLRRGMDRIFEVVEPYRSEPGPAIERWKKLAFQHTLTMMKSKSFARVVWEGVEMHLRGSTTPEQRVMLDNLVKSRNSYSDLFRATIAQAREEGDFDFENLGIANETMFMTLNSPIFWYSPRPGETEQDLENIVRQVVTFALRGLGAKQGHL